MAISLHYKTYGEPSLRPLLILHGFLGSADNWHTLAKQLAERFYVFTIDQRNHGKSPHAFEFDYEILTDDLYDFIEEHNLQEPIIIGHSMGGKVAMQFATYFPKLLHSLIVADIAPYAYQSHHDQVLHALQSANLQQLTTRQAVEKHLLDCGLENDTVQFLMKSLVFQNGKYEWRFFLESLIHNYPNILQAVNFKNPVTVPTLFLKGEKSNYIRTDRWQEIQAYFPNATLKIIPDAGHWIHAEKPNETLQAFLDFLKP